MDKVKQSFYKNGAYIYLSREILSTFSVLRNHMMFGLGTPTASHGRVTKAPYSPKVSGLVLLTNDGFSGIKLN
jgi:hypothetical protein